MNPVLAAWPELANSLGGWEITLVLAVILILYGASHLPHRPEEARATRTPSQTLSRQDELILWLAQGLDAGRISVAPGTFGSLVGLLWFAVLLVPGSLNLYLLGTAAGLAASVWCCGRAEQILGRIDPPSVVLDEIAAVPICYLPWVVHESAVAMPQLEVFLAHGAWMFTVGLFALFRLFDVVKPWPVRQAQGLPGGWGITADDLLAAGYVAIIGWVYLG